VDPNLCNSLFALVSLLRINKFLSCDAQNITCSLLRISTFIKQHFLGNRAAKNFLKLADIGFATWYLVNIIYKSDWNYLSIDENKIFHQYVLSHFISVAFQAPKSTPSSSIVKLNSSKSTDFINNKKSYIQTLKTSIKDIIHIKEVFPAALPKKIIEINKIINKSGPVKPKVIIFI